MATIRLQDSTVLSDFNRPYIVAEINTSHFGNMETAKEMIDRAKETGCDCVKFQSWSAKSLYSKSYYDENPIAKRMFKKLSLKPEELKEILSKNNLSLKKLDGMHFNIIKDEWSISKDLSVPLLK